MSDTSIVPAQGKAIAAFVKAQAAFGPALKTGVNPHFKSTFAKLDTCIEAVIDALHANGLGLMQKTHPSEKGAAIETLFLHESGEVLSGGIFELPAVKLSPQDFGSALSYARRYSLMAACGIAPEDDDGEKAQAPYRENKPQKPATGPLPDGSYQMAPTAKTPASGNPGAKDWKSVVVPAFAPRLKGMKLGDLEDADLQALYEEFFFGANPTTVLGKAFKEALRQMKEEKDVMP